MAQSASTAEYTDCISAEESDLPTSVLWPSRLVLQNTLTASQQRSQTYPRVCSGPVSSRCRIHRLHLCRGERPHPNECLGYDMKQSDVEVPVMLELWKCRVSLHCRVAEPNRVLSMSQIELNCVLMQN